MKYGKVASVLVVSGLLQACTDNSHGKASLPSQNPAATAEVQAAQPANQPEAAADKAAESAPSAPAASAASAASAAPAAESGSATPARVESRPVVQRIQGQVSAREKSSVGFKVPGFIASVEVQPGERAKKGAVLAKLDPTDYELNLQLAESRLKQAEISLRLTNKDYMREVGLNKANATTESALDKAKNALDQAKVTAKLAEIEVAKAKRAVTDTILVAPYDCLVTKQHKYTGEYAAVGGAILDLQATTSPEIALSVPERMIGNLKVGSDVNIVVPSTSYRGPARITRIVDMVSEKTRTFEVYAQPGDDKASLTTGLFVEAEIN